MAPTAKVTCGRNWCFTINNPTSADYEKLLNLPYKALVWQDELGEECGTQHIQGYVEFKTNTTRACVVKRLGGRASVYKRRRTRNAAILYCRKESMCPGGDRYDDICLDEQRGRRTDLENIKKKVDQGASIAVIAEEHFGDYLRYGRMLKEYILLKSKPRNFETKILSLWGPPGVGKSRKAAFDYPNAYWVPRPTSNIWFDGYQGEETIILDNFYGWVPYDLLLRMIDWNPLQLPTKGGHIQMRATTVVVTSVKEWCEWYDFTKCDKAELERRITSGEVLHMPDLITYLSEN